MTEECDEGATAPDETCTPDCHVRAVALAAAAMQPDAGVGQVLQLGTAPHVAASSDSGFAVVYSDPGTTPAVRLQLFGESGGRMGSPLDVAAGDSPLPSANPAVAALPGGRYVVAWTDSMAGPSEVRVRLVDGPTLSPSRVVHDNAAGFHADPDIVWAGDRLIVAYTDLLDVTYREFSADLTPLGPEAPVAATSAIESSVALATFGNGWAAAVRSNSDGLESVVVRNGDLVWWTPAAQPGPTGDRPALVALDDTHLLVVLSAGTDGDDAGTVSARRLMWSVASTATPGPLRTFMLDGATGSAPPNSVNEIRPSTVRVGDAVYVAWTNSTDDGFGEERVFISLVTADSTAPGGLAFAAPMQLPRNGSSSAWQRNLHLAASPLFPGGAVISTWESASDGSLLATVDLMLDFRPSPFVFLN